MNRKVVVIGVGNLLMGDDGIGILAAWALMKEKLPENVSVFDGATRAFDVLECGMGLSSKLNNMLPLIIDSVKSELNS